jgi:gamma-glutamyl phosphate reductase
VATINDALAKVLQLRGVSFTWKDNHNKAIGVIAQEIETVVPEIVDTNDKGIKSVSYDSIIALLIEAIKEQQSTIDDMKNKINILLRNIDSLGEKE